MELKSHSLKAMPIKSLHFWHSANMPDKWRCMCSADETFLFLFVFYLTICTHQPAFLLSYHPLKVKANRCFLQGMWTQPTISSWIAEQCNTLTWKCLHLHTKPHRRLQLGSVTVIDRECLCPHTMGVWPILLWWHRQDSNWPSLNIRACLLRHLGHFYPDQIRSGIFPGWRHPWSYGQGVI